MLTHWRMGRIWTWVWFHVLCDMWIYREGVLRLYSPRAALVSGRPPLSAALGVSLGERSGLDEGSGVGGYLGVQLTLHSLRHLHQLLYRQRRSTHCHLG